MHWCVLLTAGLTEIRRVNERWWTCIGANNRPSRSLCKRRKGGAGGVGGLTHELAEKQWGIHFRDKKEPEERAEKRCYL